MDTLRLVEVTGDGDLVLMTGDGRRFSLSVDEQVRSAVRRSRNGTHVPPPSPDRPGPREVQSRIRSGADAEQVALQTGLDVDYVRRFEGPVLAERAHVAELAQKTPVDRGGDPELTLDRVVVEVLTGEGHDVDDIGWDSRRSDGTRWEVLVVTGEGPSRSEATWSFDTGTRSLEPVDAEAERLTGVERRRRLSAVRDTVFDVERPAVGTARGGTVDLLDALARQRGRRPTPPAAGGDTAAGSADHATTEAATAPGADEGIQVGSDDGIEDGPDHVAHAAPDHAAESTESAESAESAESTEDTTGERQDTPGPAAASRPAGLRAADRPNGHAADLDEASASIEPDLLSELDLDQPAAASSPATAPRPSSRTPVAIAAADRRSRRRRTAVPSWDEIVFGARREDG